MMNKFKTLMKKHFVKTRTKWFCWKCRKDKPSGTYRLREQYMCFECSCDYLTRKVIAIEDELKRVREELKFIVENREQINKMELVESL